MKIVIFLCDRYEAHRSRGASGEGGLDHLGGPFTIHYTASRRGDRSIKGWGAFYGDSEVLVEEHDEGIVRSNGIVGMLGCTRGVCIELMGCVGERLFRRRLDYTGNVSRSGVWGKQVVRGGIGGYGSRYLLSNATDRVQSGVIVVWREWCVLGGSGYIQAVCGE